VRTEWHRNPKFEGKAITTKNHISFSASISSIFHFFSGRQQDVPHDCVVVIVVVVVVVVIVIGGPG
jgi:hypothetical protein